ncbi:MULTISPECIES: MetQ/NlpA family ABC transporter substrate-binding protein [Heyndrickxia]|uniref:Lipoprotein n=1 Tax=Heyndrickxia vini TaxID=1476025 RepID=A0ABX7E5Z1_9BACI|nr:MetQ/NlpA family ABC transporter substrate-binding protein [Heyndrickxia vini]
MKKTILLSVIAVFIFSLLAACGKETSGNSKVVTIGVTGSDGQMWDIIKEKAKKEGITIKLKEFSDYTIPNQALADGDIDLNAFQHIAFLNQFKEEHKLDITPIGTTQIAPMGMFSDKYKSPKEIPAGGEIAIPNDPSNQARALLLLQSAGLIKLKDDFGLFGDPTGIIDNPKKLKITPVVAQQTPRVLKDVAASVINNGVAGQAGLNITKESIYLEDPNSDSVKPYINIIAARSKDKDNKTYEKIIKIYHSKEVEEAVKKDTKGGSIVVDMPIQDLESIIK